MRDRRVKNLPNSLEWFLSYRIVRVNLNYERQTKGISLTLSKLTNSKLLKYYTYYSFIHVL